MSLQKHCLGKFVMAFVKVMLLAQSFVIVLVIKHICMRLPPSQPPGFIHYFG